MKNTKKFAAMIAALALSACSIAPMASFAEKVETGTITITSAEAGHTFTAYQIFKGTIDKDAEGAITFSDVKWGSGMNETLGEVSIYTELQGLEIFKDGANIFAGADSAAKVAEAIEKVKSNTDKNTRVDIDRIAEVFAKYKNDTCESVAAGEAGNCELNLNAGYYLVIDTTTSGATTTQLSKYMLQVAAGEATPIAVKSDAPKVMKKVYENSKGQADTVSFAGKEYTLETGYNDAADYSIGDVFTFELFGSLPSNYDVYEGYAYKFVDTYDAGITVVGADTEGLAATDFTVTVGDKEIPAVCGGDVVNYTYSAATLTDADKQAGRTQGFELNFADLKDIVDDAGEPIELNADSVIKVTYSAKLNANAVIGNPGNENDVKLVYSKNPYNGGSGTNKPSDEEEKGETEKDTNVVFTYEIDVTKYLNAATEGNEAAAGLAGFKLFNANKTKVATLDGNNKITDWVSVVKDNDGNVTNGTEVKTASGGTFEFSGLEDGIYTLEETSVPSGYNKMADKTIKVTAVTNNETGGTCQNYLETSGTAQGNVLTKLEVEVDGETYDGNETPIKVEVEGEEVVKAGTQGVVEFNIINEKGSSLPSTGGMGTTLFYLGGGAMVAVAGIFLITKKRAGKSEN